MTRKVVISHPCLRGHFLEVLEDRGPRKAGPSAVMTRGGTNPLRYLYTPSWRWRR